MSTENKIEKFQNAIDNKSFDQGDIRGINRNDGVRLLWEISNLDSLNSIINTELDSIEEAMEIMNKFSENKEFTRDELKQKFVINWTNPFYLHLFKSL